MIEVPKPISVAVQMDQLLELLANESVEHIQDVDEWYKINYKGQFGFTHKNNTNLKLVNIANEFWGF